MQMQDKQYIDLIQRLTEISADIKGVHRRQDITNGRLAKNEEKVIELDKTQVGLVAQIQQILEKDKEREADDKDEKNKVDGNRQYWIRLWAERVIWFAVMLAGIVLTKLGIINFHP